MIQVSVKADEMIQEFFKDREENRVIRIFLTEGGWSGPSLGMALDEPKTDDEVLENNGVTFLMEKELFEKAKPVNVDFVESAMGSGFSISSNLQLGGGNCGGSCSC